MALAARIIKDTSVPTGSGSAGGLVTVLVNMSETGTDADNPVPLAAGLWAHHPKRLPLPSSWNRNLCWTNAITASGTMSIHRKNIMCRVHH